MAPLDRSAVRLVGNGRHYPVPVGERGTQACFRGRRLRHTTGIEFSAPVALPIKGTIHPFAQRNFDITPDGRQLLVVLPAAADEDGARTARIRVGQNWFEALTRLVPTN